MKKPITPDEAYLEKLKQLPEELIEAVNQLLIENHSPLKRKNNKVTVKQKDIVARYLKLINATDENREAKKSELFEKRYMDFEDVFAKNNWKVTYHSPDYREDPYDEYYEFVNVKFK